MLCASFVVQSSTGTSYTLHSTPSRHSTLYTLYTPHSTLYTPHSLLYTPHSTLYTFHSTLYTLHSTLQTGNRENMYKRCFPCAPLCVSCLFVNCWSGAFAETMWAHDAWEKKRFVFPIAEVCTRDPRTWIHSGSWLTSCFVLFRSSRFIILQNFVVCFHFVHVRFHFLILVFICFFAFFFFMS